MDRLPKHVTLRHLNAFVAVAQEASFTQAAQRLFQTQPSITGLVRQLERALGSPLFSRTSRSVALTPVGERFLPQAMRLLSEFDGVISDVIQYGAASGGRVSVAAAHSAITEVMAGAAQGFVRQHPNVRLYLRDDNSGPIQRKVAAGEVDFGFTSPWADVAGVDCEPLLEDQFGVLYRADDPQLVPDAQGMVAWDCVRGRKVAGVVDETGIMAVLQSRAHLPVEVTSPFYEASSTTSQAALVRSGVALALMPALAAQRVAAPELRFALLHAPRLTRTLCLMFRKGQALNALAQAFADEIRGYVGQADLPRGCRVLAP